MEIGSKTLLRLIKTAKGTLSSIDLDEMRKGQETLGKLGVRLFKKSVDFSNADILNVSSFYAVSKKKEREDVLFLYLHGGAYVSGEENYSKSFGGVIAERYNARVVCLNYKLAPENPFPAALNEAVATYLFLKEKYSKRKLCVIGESAGGGLALSLALKLRELKKPLPDAIFAISPWADLEMTGVSLRTNKNEDPLLFEEKLRINAEMYAQNNLKNPLVSPVFANFKGFPPVFITVGGKEILESDSLKVCSKLLDAGVKFTLLREEKMWHVYPLFPIAEAETALNKFEEFLVENGIMEEEK